MSNDDPTKHLDTKPTIETVLERINALSMQLNDVAGQLDARITGLQGQVIEIQRQVIEIQNGQNEFRAEMKTALHKIDRRLGVLSNDISQVRADQWDLETRVDKLEEKAS